MHLPVTCCEIKITRDNPLCSFVIQNSFQLGVSSNSDNQPAKVHQTIPLLVQVCDIETKLSLIHIKHVQRTDLDHNKRRI